MTQFFTGLSDVLTNHLGEALLLLATPVIGSVTIGTLISFFINLIRHKTAKKYTEPVLKKYEELKGTVLGTFEKFGEMFENYKTETTTEMKKVFSELTNELENAKRKVCEDIVNQDDEFTPQLEQTIKTTIEVVENKAKIDVVEPIEEKVEEIIKEDVKSEVESILNEDTELL